MERVNEEDLEEELGDLMFDVLLLLKICERDFGGKVSYDRALKRCAKKIKDRCPHVFGRETAKTKEEAHAIWKRVKEAQKRAKGMHREAIPGLNARGLNTLNAIISLAIFKSFDC